jgi:hypothetical protein
MECDIIFSGFDGSQTLQVETLITPTFVHYEMFKEVKPSIRPSDYPL